MIMAYLGFLAKNKDLISCQKYVAIVQRKYITPMFLDLPKSSWHFSYIQDILDLG